MTGTKIMCKPSLLVVKFTWLLMTCKWIAAIHPSIKIHYFKSDIFLTACNRNLLWVTILMLMFPLVLFLYHEMYCSINEGLLLRLVSMLLMSYSIYSTLQIFLYVSFLTHSTSIFPASIGHVWDTQVPIHLRCSYFSSSPLSYMTGMTLLLYLHMSEKNTT